MLSMKMLSEEFVRVYNQIKKLKDVNMDNKTTSIKQWSYLLLEYAKIHDFSDEVDYWQRIEKTEYKNIFYVEKSKKYTFNDCERKYLMFSKDKTGYILNYCYLNNLNVEDVLLAAIANTFYKLYGEENLHLLVDGHGRENISADIDLNKNNRMVYTVYPYLLQYKSFDGVPGRFYK